MTTFLERVVAHGELDLIDTLAAPEVVDEANRAFGGPPGRAGLHAHVRAFRRHIGAPEIRIDRIVAAPDEVMARWTFRGTLDGPWLGLEPAGQRVVATVFSFFELADGRVVRYRLWLHADVAGEAVVFDSSAAPGA